MNTYSKSSHLFIVSQSHRQFLRSEDRQRILIGVRSAGMAWARHDISRKCSPSSFSTQGLQLQRRFKSRLRIIVHIIRYYGPAKSTPEEVSLIKQNLYLAVKKKKFILTICVWKKGWWTDLLYYFCMASLVDTLFIRQKLHKQLGLLEKAYCITYYW